MISLILTILGFAVPALGGLGLAGTILGFIFKLGRLEWLENAVPILGRACIAILELVSWAVGKLVTLLCNGFVACCHNPSAFAVVLAAFIAGRILYPEGLEGPVVETPWTPSSVVWTPEPTQAEPAPVKRRAPVKASSVKHPKPAVKQASPTPVNVWCKAFPELC